MVIRDRISRWLKRRPALLRQITTYYEGGLVNVDLARSRGIPARLSEGRQLEVGDEL